MMSLLFNYLDELLFAFGEDYFILKDVKIHEFDAETFEIIVSCKGERMDLTKHPQVRHAARIAGLPVSPVVTAGCLLSLASRVCRTALKHTGYRSEGDYVQQHADPRPRGKV